MITEKQLRKQIRKTLVEFAEKSHEVLSEQKEDKDFDPAEIEGLNLPEYLKKMLDPNVSKEVYAKMDAKVDESGNPTHQAFAIAAFALSYGEMDAGRTKQILSKALKTADLILKKREENAKKAGTQDPSQQEETPSA
jgi:hypothetical protein